MSEGQQVYRYTGGSFTRGTGRVYLVRPEEERDHPHHPGYRGKLRLQDGCVWMDPNEVEYLVGDEWMAPDTDDELITVPLTQIELVAWGAQHAVEEESDAPVES